VATRLIDTSVLIEIERGALPVERFADRNSAISVITVSELLHGVHRADGEARRVRRGAVVERLLGAIEQIPITSEVARIHAGIWADLQGAGALIDAHDLWIAATALAHGLELATVNVRHFERIPGLALLAC
jgi:tRNA(fMet)-specific endonuclease VapC